MSVTIEISDVKEKALLKHLFLQPDILQYFPMYDLREVEDSVKIWEFFCKKGASITSFFDGKACGLAFLNLQGYKKFSHQCIITILVDEAYRNKGIGTQLLEQLFILAKETFHLEILHLEVYEHNPAVRLYERVGFKKFGIHKDFVKEKDRYIDKIFMERTI